jgi:hypothetical protein
VKPIRDRWNRRAPLPSTTRVLWFVACCLLVLIAVVAAFW